MTQYGLRFPRTEREAFQALSNQPLTPRRSRSAAPFRTPLIERVLRFVRDLMFR